MPLTRRWKTEADSRDARHREVEYKLQMKPIEASEHHTMYFNKLMPSVTTPVVATLPKNTIFCARQPQDVTEHNAGKPTASVSTP
jgi:hypothetical protein